VNRLTQSEKILACPRKFPKKKKKNPTRETGGRRERIYIFEPRREGKTSSQTIKVIGASGKSESDLKRKTARKRRLKKESSIHLAPS